MAKADIWMPIYVGDYLSATSRLTTEQHGAYFLLLMDYWKNGPIPDDDQTLMQITRMSEHAWSISSSTLRAFFEHSDGMLKHSRVEREKKEAESNSSRNSARAKAASEARWAKKAQSNAPSMPKALPGGCPSPSPSPNSSLRSEDISGRPAKAESPGYSAEFEAAWLAYPPRPGVSKADAFKAWSARLAEGVGAEVMIDAVNRYAAYCTAMRTEPKFIKQPATFFGPGQHITSDWSVAPASTSRRVGAHAGFGSINYNKGINDDGTFD